MNYMKPKIIQINTKGPDRCELCDYELEHIEALDIDKAVYFYYNYGYEGSGYIAMRKDDLYDIHDLGHCSCYGPTDDISFNGVSLDEIRKIGSDEYNEDVKVLLDKLSEEE